MLNQWFIYKDSLDKGEENSFIVQDFQFDTSLKLDRVLVKYCGKGRKGYFSSFTQNSFTEFVVGEG